MNNQVKFDENAACESCGCFGAYKFDGHLLCADCYETRGSCCPEFGGSDLWRPEVIDQPCGKNAAADETPRNS